MNHDLTPGTYLQPNDPATALQILQQKIAKAGARPRPNSHAKTTAELDVRDADEARAEEAAYERRHRPVEGREAFWRDDAEERRNDRVWP